MKIAAIALVFVLSLSTGCLGAGKWTSSSRGKAADGVQLERVAISRSSVMARDVSLPRLPEIPVRKKARFCCAFGQSLGVKLGKMPLPWVRVGRVLNLRDLGPHRYDGATAAIDDERKNAFPKGEHNGLMYTCRGGFIDTAHVRETVDWVAFFIAKLDRHLETGAVIDLGDEGGHRWVIAEPVPPEVIERHGRDRVVVALSQWLGHQVMAWHEIAQWYGWSIMPLYPEIVSGFSPEDIYSNAVGVILLDDVDIRESLASEKTYNRKIDDLMTRELERLGAVPKELGSQAVDAVDQVWWNSSARLPDKGLVLRRYLDTDTELEPWLLPDRLVSEPLRARLTEHCGEKPEPRVIRIPDSFDGVPFSELMTLVIEPEPRVAKHAIFEQLGRELGGKITHNQFPLLLEQVREQNRAEFGLRADLPD